VWLQGLSQLKNQVTSSGMEPAIFRILTQCLNQLRYCEISTPGTHPHTRGSPWKSRINLHLTLIAYRIPSVVVVFVVLVFKVQFLSLIPKSHKRNRTHQLQRNTTEHSSTCHCIRFYTVCLQIANTMRLQRKSNINGIKEHGLPSPRRVDRLCGLVVRVPGCKYRGPGSIPDATRFSEKKWVWNGIHSAT
jgi:hypothetical protein